MTADVARRLFTVDEYYRMAEAGILHEDDRVELIEGEIIEMPPIGSHHASAVKYLAWMFTRALTEGSAIVSVQDPIRLGDRSQPQPDLCLLKPRADFYKDSHPTAEDVLLLIEVADSSADIDRKLKLPLYAQSAVPEVWLVDLPRGVIETHSQPSGDRYRIARSYRSGDSIAPAAFPELSLPVADILGSRAP